jgi:hypothetical protein
MTRIILKALAAALTTAAFTLTTVTSTGASTNHQRTLRNDARMCAAFTTWADHDQQGDAERWARYLPGTGRWLYWDGETLVFAIEHHAPRGVVWQAFDHVWSDCYPNTGA